MKRSETRLSLAIALMSRARHHPHSGDTLLYSALIMIDHWIASIAQAPVLSDHHFLIL
jgi:hypothetical protein